MGTNPLPAYLGAVMLLREPPRDPQQPFIEAQRAVARVLIDRAQHVEKDLLAEVFGFGRAAKPLVQVAVDAGVVGIEERAEGMSVSGLRPSDDLAVVHGTHTSSVRGACASYPAKLLSV